MTSTASSRSCRIEAGATTARSATSAAARLRKRSRVARSFGMLDWVVRSRTMGKRRGSCTRVSPPERVLRIAGVASGAASVGASGEAVAGSGGGFIVVASGEGFVAF